MPYPVRFMEELKSRLSLTEDVGRRVKLTHRGRDYTGLCPFHKEKTPSFSVSDDKGFYHCFGCGAHGDIFSFVMATDGISFPEAVEKLAAKVGMEVPKSSPAEREKEKKRATLHEVIESACAFYEKQLHSPAGKEALQYLRGRGLSDTDIANFRLGYAGTGNTLKAELQQKGIPEEQMFAAGLVSPGRDGRDSYDYFRDRVMFPIADKRGRIIAFGGRVMKDAEPKYLNSPDTDLFHKGEVLYALTRASVPAREQQTLLLVEGYMDVIALHKAGFPFAVAPLGTALTEIQIQALWKIVPEPIVCFDGDEAGQRAAMRAAERALPILKPGFSLRFIFLPDKLDPDEYLQTFGTKSFSEQLSESQPLVWLIWENLIRGKAITTPERKAALEKSVEDTVSKIADPSVQNYYRRELRQKLWDITSASAKRKDGKKTPAKVKLPECRPGRDEGKMLLAYLLSYPNLMEKWLDAYMTVRFADKDIEEMVSIAGTEIMANPDITAESLQDLLTAKGKSLKPILPELEMLMRKERFPADIEEEMQERFRSLQLKAISEELEATAALLSDCLNEPPPELWERFSALQAEKAKILSELYT
ncbi:MAG: DNA primase [Alphaproteobacteria bacterium]|nr:DNA primase [Alphaproteobacteria bacterium]